jgi:hypothetical protein
MGHPPLQGGDIPMIKMRRGEESMSSKRVLVFIEEADKKGRKAIEKSTGRFLAGYPHGILVEVDDPQLKALKKEGYQVEVQHEATMIKLKAGQFDTSEHGPKSPAALTLKAAERPTDKKSGYWLIQMVGPVKPEWGKEIASLGVTLGDYVPEHAFLAHMTADIADKVRGLPFVNWVGLYEPAYKVSPLLMGRRKRAIGDELATLAIKEDTYTPIPEGNLTVLVHTPSDRQKVIKAIEKAGGTIVAGEGHHSLARPCRNSRYCQDDRGQVDRTPRGPCAAQQHLCPDHRRPGGLGSSRARWRRPDRIGC